MRNITNMKIENQVIENMVFTMVNTLTTALLQDSELLDDIVDDELVDIELTEDTRDRIREKIVMSIYDNIAEFIQNESNIYHEIVIETLTNNGVSVIY